MDFDVQKFLADMESRLATQINLGFAAQEARSAKVAGDLAAHQREDNAIQLLVAEAQSAVVGRLNSLDELKKSVVWLTRTAIGMLVAYAVKVIFFSHLQ